MNTQSQKHAKCGFGLFAISEREPAQPPPLVKIARNAMWPDTSFARVSARWRLSARGWRLPPHRPTARPGPRGRGAVHEPRPRGAPRGGRVVAALPALGPRVASFHRALRDATDLTSLEALFCARALHVLLRKSVVKATRTQQSHAVLGENDWVAMRDALLALAWSFSVKVFVGTAGGQVEAPPRAVLTQVSLAISALACKMDAWDAGSVVADLLARFGRADGGDASSPTSRAARGARVRRGTRSSLGGRPAVSRRGRPRRRRRAFAGRRGRGVRGFRSGSAPGRGGVEGALHPPAEKSGDGRRAARRGDRAGVPRAGRARHEGVRVVERTTTRGYGPPRARRRAPRRGRVGEFRRKHRTGRVSERGSGSSG